METSSSLTSTSGTTTSTSATTTTMKIKIDDNLPESVEEAGALLGAAMTRYSSSSATDVIAPPAGIPSAFSVTHPIPGNELFTQLYSLRALLRTCPRNEPLVAAPSLLAGVLLKLLGISSSLAAAASAASSSGGGSSSSRSGSSAQSTRQQAPPPLFSTGLRTLWVDCVVLCHDLGDGLSAAGPNSNLKMNLFGFCRNMMALASMNPKSARAGGGARVAALEVLSGLLLVPKLASQLSSWAYDILILCQKAMKSSGTGEPSYRVAALRLACSVSIACRESSLKLKPKQGTAQLVLKGALEDKAIVEAVKLVKLAVADKFPNVREVAAELASHLGPLLIHTSIKTQKHPDGVASSPTAALEDILTIGLKNIDDESAQVAGMWGQALARCLCTSIEYGSQVTADKMSDRNVESGESGATSAKSGNSANTGRKGVVSAKTCSTLPATIKFLVGMFVKSGGEATAPRAGGLFSIGGRAVRVGLSRALMNLLQIQLRLGGVSEGEGVSMKDALLVILTMVGTEFQDQLSTHDSGIFAESLDATSVVTAEHLTSNSSTSTANPLFSKNANQLFGAMQGNKKSHADPGVARVATSRVIREGLAAMAPESLQLVLLHELIQMTSSPKLNSHQLQVVWIELSHLITTLGEASATAAEEIWPNLKESLKHESHGVRHEAAIATAALAAVFPAQGRQLFNELITDLQLEHAELMKLASSPQQSHLDTGDGSAFGGPGARLMRFGRRTPQKQQPQRVDESLKHQCALHGMSLALSILIRDLPSLPGGMPSIMMDKDVFPLAEQFIAMQFNDIMTSNNPSIACTCVRAGYALVCGALTTGSSAVSKHISMVFGLWQKTSKFVTKSKRFTPGHELLCIDAMLTSIVTFLKYDSELLLSIPDALSKTSLLLEELVPLLVPQGRLGKIPENPAAVSRLETAKASLMESFSWLPPGSYPMIADNMFSFAASQIQEAIKNETCCSIIRSFVNKEDRLLDATSFSNAVRPGQVGGAHNLEDDILLRTSEVAHHGEREAVLYFHRNSGTISDDEKTFRESSILGEFAYDSSHAEAPTPLHEVGTWQTPVEPSCSSKVRLIDAAIQIFATTFALKNGKDQQKAIEMLESYVPVKYSQLAKNMGVSVTSALVESADRRAKQSKEDGAAVSNIVAVLLTCLQTLPLQDSTHNVSVGLGPAWMGKAKDLLLTFLPSSSNRVRRAAAEGLSILSTIGEEAQFLQSAVLYSLDELMRGNQHDGKPTSGQVESISVARAGSLLTIASIQRTSQVTLEKKNTRARSRSVDGKIEQSDDMLQSFQIMTKLLPSVKILGPRDFFVARTSALHSFGVLLGYSNRFAGPSLSDEDLHILKKAIELVEGNFLTAWNLATHDYDRGDEKEKLEFEPSFLSVVLRLMTFIAPSLHHAVSFDSTVGKRLCMMASVILEKHGCHPAVAAEAMAFFEVMALYPELLPAPSHRIMYSDNPVLSCIPYAMEGLTPARPDAFELPSWVSPVGCQRSFMAQFAFLRIVKRLCRSHILVAELTQMQIVSTMFATLEAVSGTRCFSGEVYFRSLAAPRESEVGYREYDTLEQEVSEALRLIMYSELDFSRKSTQVLLRWILLSKVLASGAGSGSSDELEDESLSNVSSSFSVETVRSRATSRASMDAQSVVNCANPPRWQVKNLATQLATTALIEIGESCRYHGIRIVDSPDFNPALAKTICEKELNAARTTRSLVPESHLALHIGELVVSACSTATATVDQAELQILQNSAMHLLVEIMNCFGFIKDPEDTEKESILSEYIPQLSSCIKSALVATNERHGEISSRLFLVGCEALHSFIHHNITSDKGVLKRTIRSSLPESDSVPFFSYQEGLPPNHFAMKEDERHLNHRASLLIRIGQFWSLGNLPFGDPEIMGMVKAGKAELGVNAASIAIDGATLLLGSGLSLGGTPTPPAESAPSIQQGVLYEDICDIDDSVKAGLVKTWASCAASAAHFLAAAVECADIEQHKKDSCLPWIRSIASLLFAGFRDSLLALSVNVPRKSIVEWARGVDAIDVAVCCLQGISSLAHLPQKYNIHDHWTMEFETLVADMTNKVLLPTLSQGDIKSSEGNVVRLKQRGCQAEIANRACELLASVSESSSPSSEQSSAILVALLSPLELVQSTEIKLQDPLNSKIVASCVGSITRLISGSDGQASLTNAMLPLAVKILSDKEVSSQELQTNARDLLKFCLKQESATASIQIDQVATDMAKATNWEAWAVACAFNDGKKAGESLAIVKNFLADCSNFTEQLGALSAIKELVSSQQPPNDLIGRIVFSVCPEVLCMFASFATLNVPSSSKVHRTPVSADCMKISLVALGQLQADGSSDEVLVGFLVVLFETFVTVLRFNGIPNHPKPQAQSDPAIGRMCAQALLHVARTSPDPFKTCLASMADHDRAVVEFAVRGEMTGYASQSSAAAATPKKKISLAGFKQ